jgi:hypothetical protein
MPLNIGSAGVTIPPGGGYETAAEALSRMGAAAKLAEPALRRFASKEVPASGEEAIANASHGMRSKRSARNQSKVG